MGESGKRDPVCSTRGAFAAILQGKMGNLKDVERRLRRIEPTMGRNLAKCFVCQIRLELTISQLIPQNFKSFQRPPSIRVHAQRPLSVVVFSASSHSFRWILGKGSCAMHPRIPVQRVQSFIAFHACARSPSIRQASTLVTRSAACSRERQSSSSCSKTHRGHADRKLQRRV